jgi:putative ABC transport system permease protein
MWPDVRLALRQVKQRPAYALTCIAVLAFGLGASTAVFSALYSAALKPLPYPEPDRLVVVHNRLPGSGFESMGASPADYLNLSQHRELFAETGAYYFLDLNLSGVEVPKKVNAVAITASLFRVLGAQPLLGRTFTDVEQRYRGPRAVILTEDYWQSAFGRDPRILNRSLQLNGELYPIVGVMPKSFAFPNEVTQMWTPMALRDPADSRSYFLRMYARLAPGLDVLEASRRISHFSSPVSAPPGWIYFLNPVARDDDGAVRRWLWILFAAVSCFLLIVCSNVAGLVLMRSSERRFDLAVRMALGAGRWRIARQVLTEVLLLTACGGIAGLGIARIGIVLLARYGPHIAPRLETPVFWFSLALSLLTGIVCGLYPALHSARAASVAGLTEAGWQRTAGRAGRLWQQGLIVAQVGVATALLVCGGLLIHSLVRLLETPLGFDARNVLTMYVSLPPLRYPDPESRARFFAAMLEHIPAIPGVDAASACTLLPFGYGENVNTFEIVGQPKPSGTPYADLNMVSRGYFETMRIPLLRGRAFTAQDRPGAPLSTVIDETFARRFFAGEDPIGRQVKMPWSTYTIAGVVGSVKVSALDQESPLTLYFSAEQSPVTDMVLAIRSRLPESSIVPAVGRIAAGIDRDQPVYDVAPLQVRIDRSIRARRFVVWLMLVFASAGTALAAVGLYGLLSYTVALRRREIGIRMALGAGRNAIAMLVCRDGMKLVAAGILLGSGAALGGYRFIASQMYGVGIGDRVIWLAVLAIVCGSGLIASALPAWRVTRLNPAESLRME